MISDRWRVAIACSILLVLLALGAAAEPEQPVATVAQPAVVTAAAGAAMRAGASPQVVINVTGFQPAQDGPVQAVVKAQRDGQEREIGRFGIFPHIAFKAADPSQGRSFGIPLPKDLASGGPVKFNVYLVPAKGAGKGARMEIGGAEIR
jgi:hypothetical protein